MPASLEMESITIVLVGTVLPGWKTLESCLQDMAQATVHRCPENEADIVALCTAASPCILLINLAFLQTMHVSTLSTLVDSKQQINILVTAEHEDMAACRSLLRMGCKGILLPNMTAEMLRRAISTVIQGEIWMSRNRLSSLIQEMFRAGNEQKLTSREKEILELLGQGCNNQQIANALFISRETVRWHIRGLYTKIGTHNRSSVVSYAAAFQRFSSTAQHGRLTPPRKSRAG
jgi:DNA-binding NarL/FixJ family response regulator